MCVLGLRFAGGGYRQPPRPSAVMAAPEVNPYPRVPSARAGFAKTEVRDLAERL